MHVNISDKTSSKELKHHKTSAEELKHHKTSSEELKHHHQKHQIWKKQLFTSSRL
jgi:hypothetical protein